LGLGLGLVASASTHGAGRIDLDTPEGVVAANRKLQCSLKDGEPKTFTWFGSVYSRVPGERDRLLFEVEGMNVRQCATVTDPKRGTGYRMVSREVMLYKDPASGEVLRSWKNPWTGATVEVLHVANDPVNGRPTFGADDKGKVTPLDIRVLGKHFFMPIEVPLFYPNPLAGAYQEYVGGTYHATEIFDFAGEIDDLTDPNRDTADTTVAWVRIAQWLPWMEMGSRAGLMYVNAIGKKLGSWDELSDTMKAEIRSNYPAYVAPPPLDDARPNDTSWTVFKRHIDAKREAAGRPAPGSGH